MQEEVGRWSLAMMLRRGAGRVLLFGMLESW